MSKGPPQPVSAEERGVLEAEKLRAEIASLNRPWHRSAPTVVAVLAIVASVLGIPIQCAASNRASELAEIRREKAELDVVKLAAEKEKVAQDLERDRATTEAVLSLRYAALRDVSNLQGAIATYEGRLARLPDSLKSALANASARLQAARIASSQAIQQARETQRGLDALQARIGATAAFDTLPVWVSLGKRQRRYRGFYDPPFGQAIPRVGSFLCVTNQSASIATSFKYDQLPTPDATSPQRTVGRIRGQFPRYSVLQVIKVDSMIYPARPQDDEESWASWTFALVQEIGRGNELAHCTESTYVR